MADNRRHSPRLHSLNFVAEEGLMFRTLDVSREGMMLEMGSPPPLGSHLELQVAFGETIIHLPAQVVRHDLLPNHRVGVGVQFGNLDAAATKVIEEHIAAKAAKA